jgi:NTE family protein
MSRVGVHKKRGLVLTGGGARAAYQAGVLRAVAEIWGQKQIPFAVITGASAGSINGCYLASYADDFLKATQNLWDLWAGLEPDDIFRTDVGSFGVTAFRWMKNLGGGGVVRSRKPPHLLDTEPLKNLIVNQVDFERIHHNILHGILDGFVVSSINYMSGSVVSFYDSLEEKVDWERSTRMTYKTQISSDHIMASCSIPVFFPAIEIDGRWYGDGSIRAFTPLSPAVHMGCDSILAIGVQYNRKNEKVSALNEKKFDRILIADIVGTLLNSLFLGALERDIDRMRRINRSVALMQERSEGHPDRLRQIEIEAIRPSQDLGVMASKESIDFGSTLNFLLRGLGAKKESGSDVISYLAFKSSYTTELLELGYSDAILAHKNQLGELLSS